MMGHLDGLADDLAECAKEAEQNTRGKIGREYEDIVTARFLQSFSESVERCERRNPFNVEVEIHKLPDSGADSAESLFGADFLICFHVQLSHFEMSNGILVQAKRGDVDRFPSMDTIREQCNAMLRWSPDSFLNVMDTRSYRMYPAIQTVKANGSRPTYRGAELEFEDAFDYRTTLKLYQLFRGYIGDNWIYRNIDFLTNPNNNQPNDRPLAPDGGAPPQNGGMKGLVITVREPGVNIEFSFDREREIEAFERGGFESFE